MKHSYIREQRHVCGPGYQEVDLFPVTARQHRAGPRSKKRLASTQVQKNQNEKNARRHFEQKVHTNFTGDDLVCHLTYSKDNQPAGDGEAQRDLQLFIERLNYRRRKLCLPPCKFMAVTEKRGKKGINYHHHVIMDGLQEAREIKSLWAAGRGQNRKRLGFVRVDYLDFEGGGGTLNDLCAYLTKDPMGRKRWSQSKGLKQPKRPRPNDGRYTRPGLAKIAREKLDDDDFWRRRYPGWELVEPARSCYNEYTGWSVYAKLRPTQPRARPKPRRRDTT